MLQAPPHGCVLVVLECCRLGLVVTTVLYCTVLYCTVLSCTVLYCTVSSTRCLVFDYPHKTSRGKPEFLPPVFHHIVPHHHH